MNASNGDPIRVLIVEDEIEAARLVTRRLSYYPSAHFVVTHVPDLRSAARLVRFSPPGDSE